MKRKTTICLVAAALLLTLGGCTQEMPMEEIPVSGDALQRESVVYYEGMGANLVPVTLSLPLEEELPRMLVQSMVREEDGGHALEEAGLTGLLPQDTGVEVTVEEGVACVSLTSESLRDVSTRRGDNIACALVNTLTQLPAVEAVDIRVNGESGSLGSTDLSQPIASMALNPQYDQDGMEPITVYYQTVDSGLLVPVTKYSPHPTAEIVVNAAIKEPRDSASLMSIFPEGTALRSATLGEDGILTVDFNKNLESAGEVHAQKVMTALRTSLGGLEGVKGVEVTLEGEPWGPAMETQSVFANHILWETNTQED